MLGVRRWGPYAREVIEQQRAGRFPAVHIFSGFTGWNRADYWRRNYGLGSALVLPEGQSPHELRWPALDGPVIVPSEISSAILEALILALLEAGSRHVFTMNASAYLLFEQGAISSAYTGWTPSGREETPHA